MAIAYERKWENRRTRARSVADGSRDSYYGVPVIHKPHWKWEIYTYFFLGGIAGASYVLAAIARWFGGSDGQRIARVGRYVSVATIIPSPILLILDLKRPERFFNMLRVLKIRSPMSLGTWVLMTFGAHSTLLALIQAVDDGILARPKVLRRFLRRLPQGFIEVIGIFPAGFTSGYTGVLLAATAVPLWTKNYLLLGPLFVASAFSNASAAIALILSLMRGKNIRALKYIERFDLLALLTELALLGVFKAKLGKTIARPMSEGKYGLLHNAGTIGAGIAVPGVLQAKSVLFGGHPSRTTTVITSMLTLIGGFIFRYTIVMAGKESADDPAATFELTRANGCRPD